MPKSILMNLAGLEIVFLSRLLTTAAFGDVTFCLAFIDTFLVALKYPPNALR